MTEPAPPAKRRGKLPFSVSRLNILGIVAIIAAGSLLAVHNLHHDNSPNQILNVSYDPTRELYAAIDKTFVDEFRQKDRRHRGSQAVPWWFGPAGHRSHQGP